MPLKSKLKFTPHLKVWKLKDPQSSSHFQDVFNLHVSTSIGVADAAIWKNIKDWAAQDNEEVCGTTQPHLWRCETWWWPASVAQLDTPSDWRPGGRGFNPRRGRLHSFMEIDHEIFSTVILSLPLIQEGQLSVSGKRMCTILVNRLED